MRRRQTRERFTHKHTGEIHGAHRANWFVPEHAFLGAPGVILNQENQHEIWLMILFEKSKHGLVIKNTSFW